MKVYFKYPTLKRFSFDILSPKFNIWKSDFGYGVHLQLLGFTLNVSSEKNQNQKTNFDMKKVILHIHPFKWHITLNHEIKRISSDNHIFLTDTDCYSFLCFTIQIV